MQSRMPSVTESLIARMGVTRWNTATATSEGNLLAGSFLFDLYAKWVRVHNKKGKMWWILRTSGKCLSKQRVCDGQVGTKSKRNRTISPL